MRRGRPQIMLLYTTRHLIQILVDKVQSIVEYGGLNLFIVYNKINSQTFHLFLGSIVVSIPACHAGDRGSIPRRGGHFFSSFFSVQMFLIIVAFLD